jgi:hypothetical protein
MKTTTEGLEIAEELSRYPKKLREKMRDAILRLVLAYQRDDEADAAQLCLWPQAQRGPTKREGNLLRPQVYAWERKSRSSSRRRRAT